VEVRGERMQIDDALLAAMPPRSADIVRMLRGAGSFGFVFRHERSPQLPGGHANSLGIRLAQCSLCYAGFPYPLTNVSGLIRMHRGRWTIQRRAAERHGPRSARIGTAHCASRGVHCAPA
jgi:hypothetical protein